MIRVTRRFVLAGVGAVLAHPSIALTRPWGDLAARAGAFDQIRSMIVAVDGAPMLEQVFAGPSLDAPVNVKSVAKTLVSALTGCAIDRGEIGSIQRTLGQIAPGLIPGGADPGVANITVENLLAMQAGLERTSGANYGGWIASGNWVADALGRVLVADPGARMLYSTGSTHVLGAVLSLVSGQSLLELARGRLGRPLGIEIPPWTRDPQGRYMGGNQMALSPRAMVRFGEMYRGGGMWDGTRVLSADWVSQSWVRRTRSQFSGLGYGLGWFLGRAQGADFALARGYGGQVICVAPDLGMTIAITSDPDRPARSQGYFGDLMGLIDSAMGIVARG